MKPLLVFAVVLTSSVLGGQEIKHAPTVAQCQADQRLWLSKIESDPANQTTLPTYSVLHKWEEEMSDCQEVDSSNKVSYYNTGVEIFSAATLRLMDFLTRHQLWDKFHEEDEAGKR